MVLLQWFGITCSDYCKNPKLFRPSYWGGGSIRGVETPIFPKEMKEIDIRSFKLIIQNRNWIEKEFNLIRNAKGTAPQYVKGYEIIQQMKKKIGRWYDHMELYTCPGGWIMFLSPYDHYDAPVPQGWQRTRPIYSISASTIWKFIPRRGAVAHRERQIAAANIIKRHWKQCRYDPSYKMCHSVQLRNAEAINLVPSGTTASVWAK